MKVAVLVLTALFWLSFVAVAGWLTVYAVDHAFIVGRLGERGSRLGFTLLLGASCSVRLRSLPACWSRTTGSPTRS